MPRPDHHPAPPLERLERIVEAEEGALLDTPAGPVDRYGVALVLIAATIATSFAVASTTWGSLVGVVLGGSTLLFVLTASEAGRRVVRAARVFVGTLVALAFAGTLWGGEAASQTLIFLAGAALASVAPVAIIARLRRHTVVTAHTVMGALCLYLLSGLFFAYVYAFVGVVGGTTFAGGEDAILPNTVYFSFVTLATVGYGDLTPGTQLVRMLAVMEAIGGQLYLVAGVAILVGNLGRSRRRAEVLIEQPEPDVAVETRTAMESSTSPTASPPAPPTGDPEA